MADAEVTKESWTWRAAGGVLLSVLLAGYLIFNKPFALLGLPALIASIIIIVIALMRRKPASL